MTLKRHFWLFFFTCAMLLGTDLYAQTSDKKVLVHYMPWYASKPVSGYWGWHWTMNHFNPDKITANGKREVASHDYPLIGLYDSNDPDALECHVLLMKLAGIDGVVIDWYGFQKFRDYAEIHRNSEHLVKFVKKAGLQFAVCYEDQTVKHLIESKVLSKQDAVAHGNKVMHCLEDKWFDDPAYVKLNGSPVLLVFGPQYFSQNQWPRVLNGLRSQPLLYALPHLADKQGMGRAFGWPPVSGGRELTPTDWRRYLTALYSRSNAQRTVVSVAFPGFRDIYQQAQLHDSYGSIDDRNGRTFAETFELAQQSDAQIIQIATWNDYGEGTVIEPTEAAGYRYLEYVQRNAKSQLPYGKEDLRLPILLYNLKKRHTDNAALIKQLNTASDHLLAGECDQARTILGDIR